MALSEQALFGCDPTPGIVSVNADSAGRARVWRRTGNGVEASEHRFPNWFLATSLDLVAHLPAQQVAAETLRTAHGQLELAEALAVLRVDSGGGEGVDTHTVRPS